MKRKEHLIKMCDYFNSELTGDTLPVKPEEKAGPQSREITDSKGLEAASVKVGDCTCMSSTKSKPDMLKRTT